MGISASQARFLGLTARKTNIEYEGQQVNQARTALANESANAYNRLYTLEVPTPPDVTQYYKNEYTYNYGNDSYTIQKYSKNDDGTYTVTVSHSETVDEPYSATHQNAALTQTAEGYILTYGSSNAQVSAETTIRNDIAEKYGLASNEFYSYTNSSTNQTYYILKDDFETMKEALPWAGTLKDYYYSGKTVNKTETFKDATLTFNEKGNIDTISIPEQEGTVFTVTTTEVEDTEAYNAAMTAYNHKHDVYEKEIAEINAKTEKIQQEDRSLELRLRQLDTERNAVDKELETVQSIIKTNVEKVFKLFE